MSSTHYTQLTLSRCNISSSSNKMQLVYNATTVWCCSIVLFVLCCFYYDRLICVCKCWNFIVYFVCCSCCCCWPRHREQRNYAKYFLLRKCFLFFFLVNGWFHKNCLWNLTSGQIGLKCDHSTQHWINCIVYLLLLIYIACIWKIYFWFCCAEFKIVA